MTPRTTIVALLGPKGSGKTTVANMLVTDCGFTRYRFADKLKAMLRVLGLTSEQIDGSLKEAPTPLLCGKSPRFAMERLGTEWRDLIGRRLWAQSTVDQIMRDICASGASHRHMIVVDDLRFPHEVETLVETFGRDNVVFWRVWNPQARHHYGKMWLARRRWGRVLLALFRSKTHQGEAWWPTLPFDVEIENDGTMADLAVEVSGAVAAVQPVSVLRRVRVAAGFQ